MGGGDRTNIDMVLGELFGKTSFGINWILNRFPVCRLHESFDAPSHCDRREYLGLLQVYQVLTYLKREISLNNTYNLTSYLNECILHLR
jgi:hypothetical protein